MHLKLILVVGLWFAVFSAHDAAKIRKHLKRVMEPQAKDGDRLSHEEEMKLHGLQYQTPMIALIRGKVAKPDGEFIEHEMSPYWLRVSQKKGDVYTTLWQVFLKQKDTPQRILKQMYCKVRFTFSGDDADPKPALVGKPDCAEHDFPNFTTAVDQTPLHISDILNKNP